MPAPPDYLVTPAELSQYGVPGAFLAQFAPQAFQIKILTTGALGTMTWQWKALSDESYNPTIFASPPVASWAVGLDEMYASQTLPDGSYVADAVYTIDASGTVTGTGPTVTATRYDLRDRGCSGVTAEALTLMQSAVTQPLVTWGDDARRHAAAMVYAFLKSAKGATASGAGTGDENIFAAEGLARAFFLHIGEKGRPPSMTDSSVSPDGPMFGAYPQGDPLRGW